MRELIVYVWVIIVHELGHLVGATLVGVPIRFFGRGKWGLKLTFATEHISYSREIVVLLFGSLVGLVSAFVIPEPTYTPFAWVLNCLNLLPIEGLDGGGVLFCLLHLVLSADLADRLSHAISQITAWLFWISGLWIALRVNGNVAWLLIGMGMVLGR